MVWQLQSAKQKFSEVVDRAIAEGPQVVTRRGRAVVVVVAIDAYRRLSEGGQDFKRFLVEGPDFESLEFDRSKETGRAIEL
jgi:prevent-host-death family protein